MTVLDRATVVIDGNDNPLQRSLGEARRSVRKAGARIGAATDRIKKKFTTIEDSTLSLQKTLGVLAGAAGLGFAAKRLHDLGAGVEETANKFNVVMGPAADSVRARLQDLTDTIPLTRSEMEGMAAGIQDLLVPMGLVRTDAAGMSADMVQLAGDLSSFNNVGTDQVLEAMKSALAGASEPMRRFGVDTRVARLQALALEEGLIQQGEALDSTAMAQAVMLAIQEDSTDAMGDAARTAGSAANQMRFLMRDVRQAGEAMAVALVPAIQEFVGDGRGALQFLETFGDELQAQASVIAAWARFTLEAGKFAALAFAAPLRVAFNLGQVVGEVANLLGEALAGNMEAVDEIAGRMVGNFGDMKNVVTGIRDSFTDMQFASGEALEAVAGGVRTATAAARDFASALTGEGAGAGGEGGSSGLIPAIQDVGEELRMAFVQPLQPLVNMGTQIETVTEATKRLGDAASSITGSLSSAFSGLASGAASFADAVKQAATAILADLARIIVRGLIVRAILSAFPGFADFDLFGAISGVTARQHGGHVAANRTYLVGERGPELFTPAAAGNITPNAALAGGPSAGEVAAEILARTGGLQLPTPEAAATSDFYRRIFSEMVQDGRDRGVDI